MCVCASCDIEHGVRLNLSRRRSAFMFPDEFCLQGKTFCVIITVQSFMTQRRNEGGVLIQAPRFLFSKRKQTRCDETRISVCVSVCLSSFLQTAKRPRWQQGSLIETTLIIIFMFEIRSALISLKLDTHTHTHTHTHTLISTEILA